MGEVWRAEDTTLGRQIAVKVLSDALSSDPERLARFEREARTLAALNHPNIVTIFAVEKAPTDDDRELRLLTMELVEGTTLAQRLTDGPMPPREAATLLVPVCRAIAAAHRAGILHRDLKPSNILIDEEGRPLVTDFGLAKQFHAPSSDDEGTHAGEPAHMDADHNGIPCETLYEPSVVSAVLSGGPTH